MAKLMRVTSLVLLAGSLAAVACSDSNEPEEVNPTAVSTGMASLTGSFSSNVAFQSLRHLSAYFSFTAATRAAAALEAVLPSPASSPQRALASLALRGPAETQALFPVDVLGKTFAWDAAQGKYVVDLLATGAPADGVRFRLYILNQSTHLPQVPLQVVGYVDLTDRSTVQSEKLGVLVKYGTMTIADYVITGTEATTSHTLEAQGYITDGTSRLDFDLAITESQTQVLVDYTVSSSNGYTATLRTTETLATGAMSIYWLVEKSGNSLEVSGNSTTSAINCQLKFNGVTVATLTGSPSSPTVTGAGGRTFTTQDLAALQAIFESFNDLDSEIGGVFNPADLVFDF